MTVRIERLRTNRDRVLTVRALGYIVPPASPGLVLDVRGKNVPLPGQGGVALNVGTDDVALSWVSDHLEPGASIAHHDRSANRALQVLSCVGNRALVHSGAAAGARGMVIGKHGTVLIGFANSTLLRLTPGDAICVDACGVGLEIEDFPLVRTHSISPDVLDAFVGRQASHLVVRAAAILPAELAAAGIGFEAAWANLDLETHHGVEMDDELRSLRFGDVVVLRGGDHRYGRQHDPAWSTVGIIAHGASVSGGHGAGMVSMLTAPSEILSVERDLGANLMSWWTTAGGLQ